MGVPCEDEKTISAILIEDNIFFFEFKASKWRQNKKEIKHNFQSWRFDQISLSNRWVWMKQMQK